MRTLQLQLPSLLLRVRRSARVVIVVATTAFIADCVTRPAAVLSPAERTQTVSSTADGVTLTATAVPADPRPPNQVLAIEVTLANESGRPITVDHDHFALSTPTAETSSVGALANGGDVLARPMEPPVPRSVRAVPGGSASATSPWPGPFSSASPPSPVELRTPDATVEVMRAPLPEGVLENGESTRGFLFFDAVPPVFTRLDVTYELIEPNTRAGAQVIRAPLFIEATAVP